MIPQRSGDRMKTNRQGAPSLAQLRRGCENNSLPTAIELAPFFWKQISEPGAGATWRRSEISRGASMEMGAPSGREPADSKKRPDEHRERADRIDHPRQTPSTIERKQAIRENGFVPGVSSMDVARKYGINSAENGRSKTAAHRQRRTVACQKARRPKGTRLPPRRAFTQFQTAAFRHRTRVY